MSRRRIIHAFDAGPPQALAAVGLAGRFHAWRGISGRRYLATVYPAGTPPAYEGAVVVLARREADGTRVAVWAGRAPGSERALARLAQMKRASEVHIHLIAENDDERARVEADFASPVCGPAAASAWPRHRPGAQMLEAGTTDRPERFGRSGRLRQGLRMTLPLALRLAISSSASAIRSSG